MTILTGEAWTERSPTVISVYVEAHSEQQLFLFPVLGYVFMWEQVGAKLVVLSGGPWGACSS